MTLVRVVDVVVQLGSDRNPVTALDHVSMQISDGARMALTGRSGSGKTTLLYLIDGLVEPTAGSVEREEGLRSAAVFQSANLLPGFSVYENVAFARQLREASGTPSAEELLALVGLNGKEDALPDELSGGEMQRVTIARALATGPALLLCDEPTGHLDSDTRNRVLDLIDALQEQLGFAIVVSTHDLEVAQRFDEIVTLNDGRITTLEHRT